MSGFSGVTPLPFAIFDKQTKSISRERGYYYVFLLVVQFRGEGDPLLLVFLLVALAMERGQLFAWFDMFFLFNKNFFFVLNCLQIIDHSESAAAILYSRDARPCVSTRIDFAATP
jgi:hypothetical protein